MTVLRILQYPDQKLKRTATKVEDFGPDFQKVVDNILETHQAQESCAALAATQLDLPEPTPHVTVINYDPYHKDIPRPLCLVNGEITTREGSYKDFEGCMSVSSKRYRVYEKVTRAQKIRFKGQDRHGNAVEYEAEGEMARCVQHELDHLDGKIYLDHLSGLKRARVEDKLRRGGKK